MWGAPSAHVSEQGTSSPLPESDGLPAFPQSDFEPQASYVPDHASVIQPVFYSNEYGDPNLASFDNQQGQNIPQVMPWLHAQWQQNHHFLSPVQYSGEGVSVPHHPSGVYNLDAGGVSFGTHNYQHQNVQYGNDHYFNSVFPNWHLHSQESGGMSQTNSGHQETPTGSEASQYYNPIIHSFPQYDSPWDNHLSGKTLKQAFSVLIYLLKLRDGKDLSLLSQQLHRVIFLKNANDVLARMIITGDTNEKMVALHRLLNIPGPEKLEADKFKRIIERLQEKYEKYRNRNLDQASRALQYSLRYNKLLERMLASDDPDIVEFALSTFAKGSSEQ